MDNNSSQTAELSQQLMGLSSLIQLENKSRQLATVNEFGFFISNDTKRLLNYHQAVFFLKTSSGLKLLNISGVPGHDEKAPYIKWLKKLANKRLCKIKDDNCQLIGSDNIPRGLRAGWQEWSAPKAVWCPLKVNGELLGGLWISRDEQWEDPELGLLNQLCSSYAYSLHALKAKPRWWNPKINIHPGKVFIRMLLLTVACAALFIPVQLSVLAPAKISSQNPYVVTSPINGAISTINIRPNQQINKGDLLFSLDDTELRNRHNVAQKTLDVVLAEYKRSRQKFLLQADKGSDVDLLKAKISSKSAEVAFAAEQLALIEVKAPRSGIAIFGDINELIGKPVVIGEKIITLADPNLKELTIHVPVDNAINLELGAKVQMFLNIDPSLKITGTIEQTSYEAEITEAQILAFTVKAKLDSSAPSLRIGQRGTVKIFGQTTPLYYYLFRRPMASLRQTLGI